MQRRAIISVLLILAAGPVQAATDTSLLKTQEASAAMLRGKYEQAIESYDEALKQPDVPAARLTSIHNDRGVAYWRLQRYDDALKDLNKALETGGESAATLNNRANVLLDMGRYDDALADLNKAITLAPGYGAAYNNRGNVYFQQGNYQAALADYQRAITLMPTNAAPYNGRAKALGALGRPYSGLRYITRAIALNGKYTAAYRNRAQIYQHLERSDDALADYERLIGLMPKDPALYIGRGRVHIEKKHYRSAFTDFTKALELDPENAQAYTGRGAAQYERQIYDAALQDLNQAIAGNPQSAEAFYLRAATNFRLNDDEHAKADLAKAMELAPNYAEAYKLRAEMAETGGRVEDAVADYRKALELDPFLKDAPEALKRLTGVDDVGNAPVHPAVKGWEIISPVNGRYVATNQHFPHIRVLLEMHGSGEPEIIDWSELSDAMQGFGLLRYAAGQLPGADSGRFEYIAIIDLRKNIVLSIEPYQTGSATSKWEWSKTGVQVTDAEGLTTTYELRPPRREEPESRDWFDDNIWDDRRGGWGGGRRSRGYRSRGGGVFDWIFQ